MRLAVVVAVLFPALLVACGPDDAPSARVGAVPGGSVHAGAASSASAREVTSASAATPVVHGGAGHDATPHAHATTHGGEVKTVGDLHVEGRFLRSGLMVWVNDAAEQPLDLVAVSGTAVVKGPAGITTLPLARMGDHLHAALTLPEGTAADAVVTLSIASEPVSVEFRTPAVGSLAAHDHRSLHGGVVSMWGDHHVEYVARDGEVRFYVTDAKRVPVKGGVRGTVKMGATVLPLSFDPATGSLSAKASPTGTVMLDVAIGGVGFSLAFGG